MIYKKLSRWLTQYIIHKNLAGHDSAELIVYCIERKISEIGNFILLIILGLLFGKIYQVLLFIIFYSSLRRASGGYHARTHSKCIIGFIIYMVLGLWIANSPIMLENVKLVAFMMWIVTTIIVISFAPVGCENRILTKEAKYVLRKKVIKVLGIQIVICSILIIGFSYLKDVIAIISVASLLQSVTLLPIKNTESKLWLVSKNRTSYG